MAKLQFGLGIMGGPMAKRLLEAGHEVALWSYSKGKAKAIGSKACATPRAVAEDSDCVFLCVGNTAMSREVIFGKDGLAAGAKKGIVIADCSTISPKESRQMAEKLLESGIDFLDAPCTGSKAGAGTRSPLWLAVKERSLIACVPGLNQWANNSIIAVIQVRASMPSSLRT